MLTPANIQSIGEEIAIVWNDGSETYLRHAELRRASPSAENQGERDIFGNRYGGNSPANAGSVRITGWERVGNYALRFDFSDGHRTGIYSFDYLRTLAGLRPAT